MASNSTCEPWLKSFYLGISARRTITIYNGLVWIPRTHAGSSSLHS